MKKKLEEQLKEFEHTFNPQHFYCRLREFGISKKEAREIEERYETIIYKNVIKSINEYIKKI